jgi:GDP-4-dehydro-6-deoxy-D-mannose reductase
MRVFVTGGTGFAGSFLIEALLADGHDVLALVHAASSLQELPDHPRLTRVPGDLMDLADLKAQVVEAQPELIFHLAGQASPTLSWRDPARTMAINTGGTANLLEAAVAYGRPRVVVVTSADIYGPIRPEDLPLSEATEPLPRHQYGVSKWAAGPLVRLYWERYGLPVVEARPFNHIGPRQAKGFVVPDFASQLAAIKLGRQPPRMQVGNLSAERDFTDVRDVVSGYRALGDSGMPGEAYIICTGTAVSIHWLLMTLLEIAAIDVSIEYDPARMRPSDTPCLYGDYAKLRHDTGWQPRIHLRQSLQDAFDDWLARLEAGE